MIITRKIQINPIGDKETVHQTWQTMRGYDDTVYRMANMIASHQYVLLNLKDMIYLTSGEEVKIADRAKDEKGILNCSVQNTTYKVLSSKFKGEIPSYVTTGLNSEVTKSVKAESKDYFLGRKSLRNYKKGMPIPTPSLMFRNWHKGEKGNYTFTLAGMQFSTFFGRDLSGNEIIMDRAISGEYKFCDSSIQVQDKKMFLLLCVDVPKTDYKPKDGNPLIAVLGIEHPIIFAFGNHFDPTNQNYTIGCKEEYLHKRLSIQKARRSLQIDLRFANGGKGRKSKLQALERYEKAEKNYVTTKIHQYTAKLIDYAKQKRCDKIILDNLGIDPKSDKLLLRNWTYFGMIEKLKYKCSLNNIILEIR